MKLNSLNRLPLTLFAALLALVMTSPMGQSQPAQPVRTPPKLPSPVGKTHHVTGRVEKGTCEASLEGARLQVVEHWYALKGNGDITLVIPRGPGGGPSDPLSFNGRPLEQGRVLGELTLARDGVSFDVQWVEPAFPSRVPWATNVQNGRSGEMITVYRILSITLPRSPNSGFFMTPVTVPEIMFFGTETTKNVGTLKIDCLNVSG